MSRHEVEWVEQAGVAVLTLQRPERANALTLAMAEAVRQHLEDYVASGGGPVVIASTGRTFCAGLDISDRPAVGDGRAYVLEILAMQHSIGFHAGAVVAAVQGRAIGSGAEICAAADVIVATPDASFSWPEARLGAAPGLSSSRLARSVGESRAREILLSGRAVPAEEALAIGFVHAIVSADELLATAHQAALALAVPDPGMARWIKQQMDAGAFDAERIANAMGPTLDAWPPLARTQE